MTTKDPVSSGAETQQRGGPSVKAIIAILIAIAALTFVFSNVAPATLRFLFMQFTMPAWGWFLAVLIAGVVIGSLFPWFRPKRRK